MYESGSNLAVGERGQSMKTYEKSNVMKSMTYGYVFLRFIRFHTLVHTRMNCRNYL